MYFLYVKPAYVYLRQSTPGQVRHHRESTERQYALREKAQELGWNQAAIHVGPIQTVSTGLPFAIVPLKRLSALQSLRPDLPKIRSYFANEKLLTDFYYITRDTQDPDVGLRSRGIYYTSGGEDPATGSAAGCTASWMVRYGVFPAGQTVHIQHGVEIKRPSQIFVHAEKQGEKIVNVRVGGNAVEIMERDFSL